MFLRGANPADILKRALLVHAIRDRYGFRVVRDRDVLVPKPSRRFGHLFDGVFSIAGRAVHLQVALHILQGDEMRELMVFRGCDLARVLAEFRRNVVQLELRIDFLFRAARNALLALQSR